MHIMRYFLDDKHTLGRSPTLLLLRILVNITTMMGEPYSRSDCVPAGLRMYVQLRLDLISVTSLQ